MQKKLNYFTRGEWALWIGSTLLILISFLLFDRSSYLTLIASLIGAASLIFGAKGHPVGQLLMVVFSLLYGVISWSFSYYGEMITYLGMTAPMALFAFLSWLKNPFQGNKSEVAVNRLQLGEIGFMLLLTTAVTWLFYYILRYFDTANLGLSALSVTTSFVAVYLTFRRSPFYALAYAANDVILIFLWLLAAKDDPSYFSVVICFAMFLVNDLYGFANWLRMQKRQEALI